MTRSLGSRCAQIALVVILRRALWAFGLLVAGIATAAAPAAGASPVASRALPNVPADITIDRLAFDSAGRLYGSSCRSAVVVRFDAGGPVVVAGDGTQGFSGDGGPATSAQLGCPFGIAFDARGMFIADHLNGRVRLVDPAGVISTFAGGGGRLEDGVPATEASLVVPTPLTIAPSGDIYVGERDAGRVRRIDPAGTIVTVAGNGTTAFGGDGGPATAAGIDDPEGLLVDASGDLYIAGGNQNRVRRVDTSGIITTIAGDGTKASAGDEGPATRASLSEPEGLAMDAAGALYVAEPDGNRIRRVGPDGIISTIAGTGAAGSSGDGGPAVEAQLNAASGIVLGPDGALYVASDPCVRAIGTDGVIRPVWCRPG